MLPSDETGDETERGETPFRIKPDAWAELEREFGVKDEPARASGGGDRGSVRRPRGVAGGEIPPDPWPIALHLAGRLGAHLGGGKWAVWCMNDEQHTNPDGSAVNAGGSCALLPPIEDKPYGLPICQHGHCKRLRLADWREFIGPETWALAVERAKGEPDPDAVDESDAEPASEDFEVIVARAMAKNDPGQVLAPAALRIAVEMRRSEPQAFEELCRKLRGLKGFSLTQFRKALDSTASDMKREESAARKAREAAENEERQARRAREAEEKRALLDAATAKANGDVADHFGNVMVDETAYFKSPGRMWMETTLNAGSNKERTVTDTLCEFSAHIIEVSLEAESPEARPRPTLYVLSICRGPDATPYRLELPAEDWGTGTWHERSIPCPGIGAYGRTTREHLRRAIEALSPKPAERLRYRHTGWIRHESRPVYLHAAGAIDAQGDVAGLRAEPSVERVNRFALPAVADTDVKRDVGAMVALFRHEPAKVWIVAFALALRAAMGGARNAVHITGRSGLGKSVVIGCVSQLFGPSFSARNPLLSWRARGNTVQGMMETAACARDVFLQIDDLQRNPESMARATAFLPAHFEGTGQMKGRARGGALSLRPSQGVIGSSGETLPDEPSVRNRTAMLDLDEHPTPQPDEGDGCLKERGDRGELAGGMALFIRWWAGRYDEKRDKVSHLERDAVKRWGLGVAARAAEVMGPAAFALDEWFAFLRDVSDLEDPELDTMRERAKAAMGAATVQHVEHVATEANWCRYLALVGEALGACAYHALHGTKNGKAFTTGAPPNPSSWGWKVRRSTMVTDNSKNVSTSVDPSPGGVIAYLRDDKPGKVLLAPSASLRAAISLAQAERRPLQLDVSALARELIGAPGMLTSMARGRGLGQAKWSWGSVDVSGFEVSAASIGIFGGDDEAGEEGCE